MRGSRIFTVCRWCGGKLNTVLSLGRMPIVNYFPTRAARGSQRRYPLTFCVCGSCGLAQTAETIAPERIFRRYHYVTGASWPLVRTLEDTARLLARRYASSEKKVLDIGSNDGTLLLAFQKFGWKGMGVEPSAALARAARIRGSATECGFFSRHLAKSIVKRHGRFPLVTATHVLANIADLHDFLSGVGEVLSDDGVFVVEVDDLEQMVKNAQFDSIYHEHYSYFSRPVLERMFDGAGLHVVRSETNLTQGGSLRMTAVRNHAPKQQRARLSSRRGFICQEDYRSFAPRAASFRRTLRHLLRSKLKGKTVAGYGAPAKGVPLLNFCGLDKRDIAFVVDSTVQKQGRFVPGTHIPVYAEEHLKDAAVDAILVLCWNYRDAVRKKLRRLVRHPVTLIFPFPKLEVMVLGDHTTNTLRKSLYRFL